MHSILVGKVANYFASEKCYVMWHIGKFRFSGELVSFKELGQLDLINVLSVS